MRHERTCALDGVYVEADDGSAPSVVPAAPPSSAELYVLAERVALRAMTWLRKGGHAKVSVDPRGSVSARLCGRLGH